MDRAQAHTLEAVTAAMLLLIGVIFATQATAVTPLSASTSNQHIENQQEAVAGDLLEATNADGSLREAITYWNDSAEGSYQNGMCYPDTPPNGQPEGTFNGTQADRVCYTNSPPDHHPMADAINETFDERRLAYNVEVTYRTGSDPDETETVRLISMGTPSNNAVSASRTVYLYDDTELSGGPSEGTTLKDANDDEFYIDHDVSPDGQLYNVVEVRTIVWRL